MSRDGSGMGRVAGALEDGSGGSKGAGAAGTSADDSRGGGRRTVRSVGEALAESWGLEALMDNFSAAFASLEPRELLLEFLDLCDLLFLLFCAVLVGRDVLVSCNVDDDFLFDTGGFD